MLLQSPYVFSQQLFYFFFFQAARWRDQTWLLPRVTAQFVQLASGFLFSALEPEPLSKQKIPVIALVLSNCVLRATPVPSPDRLF